MNVKKMASLCKKARMIELQSTPKHGQWIGDGMALYPVYGLPQLTLSNVCTLFELSEYSQEHYTRKDDEFGTYYKNIEYDDITTYEIPVECWLGIQITILGRCYFLFKTATSGIVAVEGKYLQGMKDGFDVYERKDINGYLYLAIKEGQYIRSLVRPVNLFEGHTSEKLKQALGLLQGNV